MGRTRPSLKLPSIKTKSDGLGGFRGVSQTLKLGAEKRLRHRNFHFIFILLLVTQVYDPNAYGNSCLSIIISLQYNNEAFKNIHLRNNCKKITSPNCNIQFTLICIRILFNACFLLWIFLLMMLHGDIHPNPGPDSVSSENPNGISSITPQDILSNHLSIFHYNVQSLLPKLDLIRAESESYDIAVFSETWLKPNTTDAEIALQNFLPPFRTDRRDRPGGGVAIYIRDTLLCKRRKDLEINGLEAVWVEVTIKSKKVIVGGIYRPPNSNADYFNLMLESIDRAYNTNIYDIIITGDFNYNMLFNNNKNKISDLLLQFNLTQLITEATHFTEKSSSLIDLIMVRNRNNILTSGVADPLLPNLTRYHCPVYIFLKFIRP